MKHLIAHQEGLIVMDLLAKVRRSNFMRTLVIIGLVSCCQAAGNCFSFLPQCRHCSVWRGIFVHYSEAFIFTVTD
jgi:hypothetical protein